MRRLALVVVAVGGLLAACTSVVPASPGPALGNTSWVVTQLDGRPTLADNQPTVTFDGDGTVTGNTGCNNFFGDYQVQGASLTIGTLGQTEMGCLADGVMDQELAFTQALAAAASVRTAGDGLEILDGSGTVLLVLGPVPPVSLEGTAWQLAGLVDGSTVAAPLEGATVALEFTPDRLAGKACNSFTAAYALDGDSIAISEIASTRMLCTETGVMDQETEVLEVLGAATTVQLTRGVLLLTAPDGRGLQFAAG